MIGMMRNISEDVHAAKQRLVFILLMLFIVPLNLHASFIESTIGTAVVNDATATYHNPAALVLLQDTQAVALGSFARFSSDFTGQSRLPLTGQTLSGNAKNQTHYYLPSLYLAVPTKNRFAAGVAVISNFFNRELDDSSILRYAQSGNRIQNVDLVPAIGIKINEYIALGLGVNFSKANFILEPVSGFPGLNVPDQQSHNQSSGTSWGGDLGLLLKPSEATLIGFNYRSANTYHQRGTSVLDGNPPIGSSDYHFEFWTPARSTLSINQFVTSKLGFIATAQYIQWHIFQNVTVYDVATQLGSRALIVPQATAPYYFHNAWLLTIGTHYRIRPDFIFRLAGTYNQSPGNGHYQIINADSYIFGGSIGYDLSKRVTVDASYAHAFINSADIQIASRLNQINGANKGARDSISLKLTIKELGGKLVS